MDLEMLKKKFRKLWKVGGIMLSDFKICSKPTVIEISDVRVKVEGQWNRIKKLEIAFWLVYLQQRRKYYLMENK